MWYFCFYAETKPKQKLISISLSDFQTLPEKNVETSKEVKTEEFDKLFEELESLPEPKPEPNLEPEPVVIEPEVAEPVLEKVVEEPESVVEEQKTVPEPIKKQVEPKKKKEAPKPKPEKKVKPIIRDKPQVFEQKPIEKPIEETKPIKQLQNSLPISEPAKSIASVAVKVEPRPAELERTISAKSAREADKYIAKVAKLFERKKRYPESARKKHIQGVVALKFYIDKNGKVTSCKAINEPDTLLSNAAIELVTKLALPKPPKDWEPDRAVIYHIKYSLR